jgi:hypothetical protein
MKTCTVCGEKKPLTDYHKRAAMKDGRRSECRGCCNRAAVLYRQANKEKVSIYNKKWKQENRDKHLAYISDWRENNTGKTREYSKYYIENVRDKEKHKGEVKAWRNANIDKCRAKARERQKYLFANDIDYRTRCYLRNRLYGALNGKQKADSIVTLVGCSIPELRAYLAKKFNNGMSWDNYGEWHIDHIRPCASFDLSDPEQQKQCFNYTNLQPLWAKDNLSKGAKIVGY